MKKSLKIQKGFTKEIRSRRVVSIQFRNNEGILMVVDKSLDFMAFFCHI